MRREMNNKIWFLILSDILILSSFGLISPIFAIYINESLAGGLVAAGLATTIFLVTRSVLQLPLSIYIDKHHHKIALLLFGTALIVCVPFIYSMSKTVTGIFIAQGVYGLGAAFAYPTWFSLFTAFLDKKHKGLEYSIYSTSVGIATAITAYVGANVANWIGFKGLFFVVGGVSFLGFLLLIFLDRKYMHKVEAATGLNLIFGKKTSSFQLKKVKK